MNDKLFVLDVDVSTNNVLMWEYNQTQSDGCSEGAVAHSQKNLFLNPRNRATNFPFDPLLGRGQAGPEYHGNGKQSWYIEDKYGLRFKMKRFCLFTGEKLRIATNIIRFTSNCCQFAMCNDIFFLFSPKMELMVKPK